MMKEFSNKINVGLLIAGLSAIPELPFFTQVFHSWRCETCSYPTI